MTESFAVADLTFVTRNGDGTLDLWTPERPENYAAACAMGRDYGSELMAFMKLNDNLTIFGAVVRAIARGGEFGGVETGFCAVFALGAIGVEVKPGVEPAAMPIKVAAAG
jgi:hypothetical protein